MNPSTKIIVLYNGEQWRISPMIDQRQWDWEIKKYCLKRSIRNFITEFLAFPISLLALGILWSWLVTKFF